MELRVRVEVRVAVDEDRELEHRDDGAFDRSDDARGNSAPARRRHDRLDLVGEDGAVHLRERPIAHEAVVPRAHPADAEDREGEAALLEGWLARVEHCLRSDSLRTEVGAHRRRVGFHRGRRWRAGEQLVTHDDHGTAGGAIRGEERLPLVQQAIARGDRVAVA